MKNLGGKWGRVGGMYSIIFNFIDLISFSVLFLLGFAMSTRNMNIMTPQEPEIVLRSLYLLL